ncbi:type II toxin-antitoxin system VapB family antitoxin [Benzoatithermus flavus]|uniref:Type II toxin-antitoxin system VapB family antitoxin n=1 Tax=Benzoatithermus flavus TaxID=3108223 RepID=A0ABU8XRC2_9PROT
MLKIGDAETDQLARELAELTGEKIADAVRKAIQERLARECRRRERGPLGRIEEIVCAYNAKPVLDPRTPGDMLYDECGLPK